MHRNTIYAGVSVILAGLLGFSWAQERDTLRAQDSKPAAGEIAVVDMGKIFNSHKGLLAKMEDVKRETERAKEESKAIYDAAREIEKELKSSKPGSAEHGRLQKELQEKGLEFKKLQEETQKKLNEEQAKHYLETYQSVTEEVQRIAEARGFKLVLNFSSEPIDLKDLNKTMQVLSRQVLYQNGLDITDDVLQAVN